MVDDNKQEQEGEGEKKQVVKSNRLHIRGLFVCLHFAACVFIPVELCLFGVCIYMLICLLL